MRALDLYVFAGWREARAWGFRDDRSHQTNASARAFWPGADPNSLRGHEFARVIFMRGFSEGVSALGLSSAAQWECALDNMRINLRHEPMSWVVL